ncbi:KSR1 Kinase, partial [Donacobius atricapilla]|nr:KSR1 Kinase [Donacobius atricapilla]
IPEELTLDALLEMNESKVKETMKRCGARDEECSRLNGALSCLRKVTESGGELRDDVPVALPERRDSSCSQPDPAWSPCAAKGSQPQPRSAAGGRPRTPHSITVTPPATPQPKRRHRLKPPRTPPPPCRKVFQLLP